MIEPFLQRQLEPVASRIRRYRLWTQLSVCWGMGAAVGLLLLWLERRGGMPASNLILWWLAGVGFAGFLIWRRTSKWHPDYREVARQIETQNPQLHSLLLTAIEQRPDPTTGNYNYLQERVIQQAVYESRRHSWLETVPAGQMWRASILHFVSVLLLAMLLGSLRAPRAGNGTSSAGAAAAVKVGDVTVTPGNAEIEKGSPLAILARFDGSLPAQVSLIVSSAAPGANGVVPPPRRVPLMKSLDDPVFATTITEVTGDLTYQIEYGARKSPTFRISVFEYPKLERADARITFPSYTQLAPKQIPDTRRVSAVEGSRVDFDLLLNKPVRTARLVGRDRSELSLNAATNTAQAQLRDFLLATNGTYELRLVDLQGRTNRIVTQFVFEALSNRRPEIKIASPRGDQRVSPLEEVSFAAEVWDDFGVIAYGLSYGIPGMPEKSLGLTTNAVPNQKHSFTHALRLEELKLEPGSLVSWYVWAEDIGPDGKPRRTTSDLYFAEVRPFEEIFRKAEGGEGEGESPPPGQQQSQKLLEMQKQIIGATFKLQRREAGPALGPFAKDADVVKQSQETAIEMVEAAKAKTEDPKSKAILDGVTEDMRKAVASLGQAADEPSTKPLAPALDAEQAAFQGLLRLQAREFQVSRSKSKGKGQQASSSQLQNQLDQLEMQKEDDRYETQKQATPEQNPQQREQLQVMNRLKELAQRQQDLNQQLKEVQAALQAAQTDEEREELRRRLKRLREEQQQMLADVDELKQRLDKSADPSSVAEAKQQLEQTRAEMQRAAEAMEKGQPSQALAEGTRAQQNLQQAKEDFRKKTANQFADDLKKLRSEARQLAQQQQRIGEDLQNLAEPKRKLLSDSEPKDQVAQQLSTQRSSLTNLLQQMRQVSEQAEASEPLLSRNLYDTLRKADQDKTEKQLEMSAEMLKRGFNAQANQASQQARSSIDELKRGVERAAERILGDDTEALRQARKELDALKGQAEQEMAQAAGDGESPDGQGQAGQDPSAQSEQSSPNGARPGNSPQRRSQGQASRSGQAGQPTSPQGADPGAAGQESETENGGEQASAGDPQANPQNRVGQRAGQQARNGRSPQGTNSVRRSSSGNSSQAGARDPNAKADPAQAGTEPGSEQASSQEQQQGQNSQGQPNQAGQARQPGQRGQAAQRSQQGQRQQGQGQQAQAQQGQQGQQGQGQQAQAQQGQGQGQQGQGQQGQGQLGQGRGQRGQRPGQQQANAQGRTPAQRGQAPGQGAGQPSTSQEPNPNPAQQGPNSGRMAQQGGQRGQGGAGGERENPNRRGLEDLFNRPNGSDTGGPITGENAAAWADRLRDVEEMIDDPALRGRVAQVREQARQFRVEYKKHGKDPQWDLVKAKIIDPLAEVRQQVSDDLARRESQENRVPIDRDPVPAQFTEKVKKYYERLGGAR